MPEPPRDSEGNPGPPPDRSGRDRPREVCGLQRPGRKARDVPVDGATARARGVDRRPNPVRSAWPGSAATTSSWSTPDASREMELDYEEGIELWKAGDPEGGPRRPPLRPAGVRRQPLGPRRPRPDRPGGVPRPDAGARPFRLRVRAGPAGIAARLRGPAAAPTGPPIGRSTTPSTAWSGATRPWASPASRPSLAGAAGPALRAAGRDGRRSGRGRRDLGAVGKGASALARTFSTLGIFRLAGIRRSG